MGLSANAKNSGTCGPNLKWLLTDDGVLTISGIGKMDDYNYDDGSPWENSGVERIIIGDSVTTIGDCAFYGCRSLTYVTIGNSVTTIGDCAFYGCIYLTFVIIPNSVTTIGDGAFNRCIYLTSVTIPNGVTTIGDGAFSDCSSLTSVTIPNSVTTIGDWAFCGCISLMNFTFGSRLQSIGREAFSGCVNITHISSKAVVPPTCGINALKDIKKWNCKLIVPKNSLDAYKQAYQWKNFSLIEGRTTGITNTVYNKAGLADVYTLDGTKRLSKASTDEINALPKGVYIVNGKKIIIK